MNLQRRIRFSLFLLYIGLPFGALRAAGSSGRIQGLVVDRDNHPLPGAAVVLEFPAGSAPAAGIVTNALGEYRFENLPPGKSYVLRASLPTYQTVSLSEIEVSAADTTYQTIVLRPAITERVVVTGKSDVVQTDSAVTRTQISSDFLTGLPVLGRDYQDILTLAPGVTDVNNTGNPNIHGARDVDVMTLVDGVNTTDPFTGLYGQELNAESIQEIEVVTAGATAEMSRAQGGFVNIITRSGGNEFKGTFKFYMRSSRLDGDGAGIDPAEVRGGVGEKDGFRDLKFADYYPFVSVSGPFLKDHLWYYFAPEFVQIQEPYNAGTQIFILGTRSVRATGKVTWQIAAAQKLSFTALYDHTNEDNQGLDSRTLVESGYAFDRGGPTLILRETAIFRPTLSLESTLSRFDQTFAVLPTLNADTNHNGILFVDNRSDLGGNNDGFLNAFERDAGEDFDADGAFDIAEDFNHNGKLDLCSLDPKLGKIVCLDDYDRDGKVTPPNGCEGNQREDINCNGIIDQEVDRNMNGRADPDEDLGIPCENQRLCPDGAEPGTKGNGRFDTEDRNGSHELDTVGDSGYTSFPFWHDRNGDGVPERGEFLAPAPGDRDYTIHPNTNRTEGPFYFDYEDGRTRNTWKEDLSSYLSDLGGSHDLKSGIVYEKEDFSRLRHQRPLLQISGGRAFSGGQSGATVGALLPTQGTIQNSAGSDHLGFYVQDTYKPIPNLSLGLGLRFDREAVSSHGFEYFDPAAERRQFDLLTNLRGIERNSDLNADGVYTKGIKGDPLYDSGGIVPNDPNRADNLSNSLGIAASRRFTRHNYQTSIISSLLKQFGIDDPQMLTYGRPRQPQDFVITNNNLAPRLSLSWDPAADGKTKVFGSWGRFYGNLFLQSVIGEEGPDIISTYYQYDADGVDASGFPDHQIGKVLSKSPPSAVQVDRGLKTPFTDELTLGFEREIGPELSVSFTTVRRAFRDQLQDIDVNHTVRRPPNCLFKTTPDGYCDGFGLSLFPPPGAKGFYPERIPDGYPDLYIENLNFNQIFRVGNYNYQDYLSYELHFVRRLRRKWLMDASYVYSKAQGQAESFNSESGDDPALTELKSGYLEYDQRHVVKFHAVAYLPRDWQIGGGINWSSGLPYSFVNRFQSNDNVDYVQIRRLFGYHDTDPGYFHGEPRNNHRNAAVYDVSARAQRNFVIGKASAGAFFEVFNLLNTDDLRVFEIDDRVPNLQANEQRLFGRRFQFGISLNF